MTAQRPARPLLSAPQSAVAREGRPDEPARMPSIYEVARQAGVSVATVSRVLNGKGPVREETRRRVRDAVAALDYVPHSAARSLSTRRTMAIGVLLPDMHGAFFSELVRGIDVAARALGYHVLVSGSHSDPAETVAVLQALHGRVDGLILMMPGLGAEWLRAALPRRVPVVLLNQSGESETGRDVVERPNGGGGERSGARAGRTTHPQSGSGRHHSLRVDNRAGARLAVEHLVGLGHRSIAFVGGPPRNSDAAERLAGYRQALAAAGLPQEGRVELDGDFGEESGVRAGAALARMSPRPTAVFAANDAMAIGCLAALREHGLRVPDDISLVGFDDIPIARYLTPALTTVQVPIADLGRQALACLLQGVEQGSAAPAKHAVIAPTLAIRASAAAAGSVAKPTSNRGKRRTSP